MSDDKVRLWRTHEMVVAQQGDLDRVLAEFDTEREACADAERRRKEAVRDALARPETGGDA